ncbi:MAG: hypothetical protein EOS18_06965 [Mesorhizobium sp.]|nr:MAG: hypothetical protein EOS18_06965 [Mesorhizobium sp.]
MAQSTVDVGAAPHCPAGHFSPYSDGEKDACTEVFGNLQRCRKDAGAAASSLLPVAIRGGGSRMRGSAN